MMVVMMDMEEEGMTGRAKEGEVAQEEEDHQGAMDLDEVEALEAEVTNHREDRVKMMMMMTKALMDHLMTVMVSGQPSKEGEQHLHSAAHMHQECATAEEGMVLDRMAVVAAEEVAEAMMAVTHRPRETLIVHQDHVTLEYQLRHS